jgi:hypothetical protein
MYAEDMPLLQEAVFATALPMFIAGYLINYQLPRLSASLINYPVTSEEALSTDETSCDPEKGSGAKSLQINGKCQFFKFLLRFSCFRETAQQHIDIGSILGEWLIVYQLQDPRLSVLPRTPPL